MSPETIKKLKSLYAATDQRKWTVKSCGQDDCWCRCIGIEGEPVGGEYICASGCLSKADAEFIVEVHNNFLNLIETSMSDKISHMIIQAATEQGCPQRQGVLPWQWFIEEFDRMKKLVDKG